MKRKTSGMSMQYVRAPQRDVRQLTVSRLQLCLTYYWVSYEGIPGLILFNSASQRRESARNDYHMTVFIVSIKVSP